MPEQIFHESLPDSIVVVYEPMKLFKKLVDIQKAEIHSGSYLIRKTARDYFSAKKVEIIAEKYEKPKAFINDTEVSVSFSHTNDGVVLAMSSSLNVGCDMEVKSRLVSESLAKRMRNPKESNQLYASHPLVQIWTFKEAALKMIGTGLRYPMNLVRITADKKNGFDVEFNDGKQAKICSFQHNDHWISICYQTHI